MGMAAIAPNSKNLLQLGDHAALHVRGVLMLDQAAREIRRVELLEYVLVLQEFEDNEHLREATDGDINATF